MTKRGPKPVDMGMLTMWEFEWYKALHLLRDGSPLPYPYTARALYAPPQSISLAQVRNWIRKLKEMDVDEYLRIGNLTGERISGEKGATFPTGDEGFDMFRRDQARADKEGDIAVLETYLNPKKIPEAAERRQLWEDLWRARTLPALKKVCDEWASLPDVRFSFPGPQYVLANAREFLRMKRDKRFPRSDSPAVDESRLEYLARGMAGIMAKVSPMTGIQLLRTMKHSPGGPFCKRDREGGEYCGCWRCGIDRSRPAYRLSTEAWWKVMARFMELADKTKSEERNKK